ncbi:lipase family protein [Nocardia yamanashiensis]|uniref:alpha/beta hydrolase n=1 Tax=Nocardia yamanashiensis TaxID=209247 RepID=UPI001E3C0774|nr:lipase family protein [Nocardia yamanashiensis]UGT39317.1 lipase family protein [Nocardia yamanashiensis]
MRTRWAGSAALALATTAALISGGPAALADPAGDVGTVTSTAPLAPVATPPGAVDSERFLYTTTTAREQETTASAAVYFPPGDAPAGGWPVLAWAHGTLGLGDQCAYSIAGPAARDRDWAYLATWLRQGYAIVAADYAGLGTPGDHPYLNGTVEAHNVVDSVKAATRHYPALSQRWAVIGQSQGGGAAVTTARYATEFGGPELDYRGAVGTGVPAYIEDIMLPLGPGVPPVRLPSHTSGYVLYILAGLRTTYPELDIDSYLTDSGRDWLNRANASCLESFGTELTAANVVVGELFARPLAQLADLPGLLTRYMGLPESGYDRPVFLGQGLLDTDVLTPATLAFAAKLQAGGQPVTVRTYPTDHSGAVNASLVDSVPFVRSLFG